LLSNATCTATARYDPRLGALEEHAAAVKLQALTRGKAARKRVQTLRADGYDAASREEKRGGDFGFDGGGGFDGAFGSFDGGGGGGGGGGDASEVFRAYFTARADGSALLDPAFEEDCLRAAREMPAFKGLPSRHLSHVFSSASLELHPPGAVIAAEGARGESMCVVVGGEVALFQKNINPKGAAG
jgi:hypothetical protein